MALKSPMMPSPSSGLSSSFSPYTDSPSSPAPHGVFNGIEKRSSGPSDSLAPPSPYPNQIEPSPVDSNGTETTEIEEEEQEVRSPNPATNGELQSPDVEIRSPQSASSDRPRIDTQLPDSVRSPKDSDDPQSVIHVPSGFKNFEESNSRTESPTDRSDNTVVSPTTPEAIPSPHDGAKVERLATGIDQKQSPMSPVNTDIPRFMDRTTPRAQTRQELDEDWKHRSRRASSLEDIPETLDKEESDSPAKKEEDGDRPTTAERVNDNGVTESIESRLSSAEQEVAALRTALSECWTLCNTLANLSSSHRQRTFKFGGAGKQEVQEQAWRSCWRLCQNLYDSRDEDHASQVVPTLEMCRDFCQSLFEARQKPDEASDSVLRVSFELNNHLYNTHDRSLPEAFNERTLDFYITLCHRLMKQRTSLPQETDALLRACWSLAEMLFNLRQSNKEGKSPDEELLGSAVQACWELCDLFREGWTQIRPDRGTPRPSQTTFPAHSMRSNSTRSGTQSSTTQSNMQLHNGTQPRGIPPETPTTIFDDSTTAASSPDSAVVPGILVLGPASTGSNSIRGTHHDRWSSNASVMSGYSESASSNRTSSTATATTEDAHLTRLRCLLLKAGMNTGYSKTSGQHLPAYVNTLPDYAFGTLPWQKSVFTSYKVLVLGDKTLLTAHTLPSRRLGAVEVAKSVKWLGNGEKWAWMRDLYRLVFGFGIDEGERRGGSFQT
ncbi:uncharacterized protein LTR77_004285 [Saxophila tyrrhenica]|uniref:DUF7624 domain-containing protein n=1 Tax=Saxophila tyrrhenica TaxID=1690608 RepID=A0AAV9PD69_9PEZI|nr:hypothetical protein LTR77_004285 [Saxophila tyrrhenica]